MEDPNSSTIAKVLAYISILMILLSTVTYCLETVPTVVNNSSKRIYGVNFDILFISETVVILWFTIEYILRTWSTQHRLKFVLSFMGILDLLVIVPYYVFVMFYRSHSRKVLTIAALRLVRMVRVMRIFRLSRYSRGLSILGKTIRQSAGQLVSLLLFMLLALILWASIIYYNEYSYTKKGLNHGFESIPATFWFIMITMTTVGYGDVVPLSYIGKLASAMCMVSGVIILLCLPTPVFICHFSSFYSGVSQSGRSGDSQPQLAEDNNTCSTDDVAENRKSKSKNSPTISRPRSSSLVPAWARDSKVKYLNSRQNTYMPSLEMYQSTHSLHSVHKQQHHESDVTSVAKSAILV